MSENWLEIAKRRYQLHIIGSGRWAVRLCHHVQLSEWQLEALSIRRESCGIGCCGVDNHRIEELRESVAPIFRRGTIHKMMAAED
jgi:hypothetical protein